MRLCTLWYKNFRQISFVNSDNLRLPEHNGTVELFWSKIYGSLRQNLFYCRLGTNQQFTIRRKTICYGRQKILKFRFLYEHLKIFALKFINSWTLADSSVTLFEWATNTSLHSRSWNLLCRFHWSTAWNDKEGAHSGTRWEENFVCIN